MQVWILIVALCALQQFSSFAATEESQFTIMLNVWHGSNITGLDHNNNTLNNDESLSDVFVKYFTLRGYAIDEISSVSLNTKDPDWRHENSFRDLGMVLSIDDVTVLFEFWDDDAVEDDLIIRFNITDQIKSQLRYMYREGIFQMEYTSAVHDQFSGMSANFTARLYYEVLIDGKSISLAIIIPSFVIALGIALLDFRIFGRRNRTNLELGVDIAGNTIFMTLGGLFVFLFYGLMSCLYSISVVGKDMGKKIWDLSILSLLPFGREVKDVMNENDITNLVEDDEEIRLFSLDIGIESRTYLLCGGFIIPVLHFLSGIICLISLIGIPVAGKHFQAGKIMLAPSSKFVILSVQESLGGSINSPRGNSLSPAELQTPKSQKKPKSGFTFDQTLDQNQSLESIIEIK